MRVRAHYAYVINSTKKDSSLNSDGPYKFLN